MKKILILTLFYQNYNYGGILQAYALYHRLEQMGFECEELNYSQSVSGIIQKVWKRGFRIIEIAKDPRYFLEQKKKSQIQQQCYEKYIETSKGDVIKNVFESFMKSEFLSTSVYTPLTIGQLEQKYDAYIVGGDQVWNPEWMDKNYFLRFVKQGNKVAYSCSAGKSRFSSYDKKKILKYIDDFDVVSVRENNFSQLLDDNKVKHELVADPVFLLTKEEWEKFSGGTPLVKGKYMFVYLLGEDEMRRKQIKQFSIQNDLKIAFIPHVYRRFNEYDEGFADYEIRDAGPREFVNLLSNASFVMTDSFHGTAFSILMERQFINFSRFEENDIRDLNVRLQSVLMDYSLESRMKTPKDLGTFRVTDIEEIDYERISLITMDKRDKAIAFLKGSLRGGDIHENSEC